MKVSGFFMSFLSILKTKCEHFCMAGDTFNFYFFYCRYTLICGRKKKDSVFRDQVYFYKL